METYENIGVFHNAAIGDTVLATPVLSALRQHYKNARITHISHPSVAPLLALCPDIANFIAYEKAEPLSKLRAKLRAQNFDLLVDLSGSWKSTLATSFLCRTTLRYKKIEKSKLDTPHAADNFVETLRPLGIGIEDKPFPTIFPRNEDLRKVNSYMESPRKQFVALVPGVGTFRPHRAWPEHHWFALAKNILWSETHSILLIGGHEERALCSRIAEQAGPHCFNLAGKLNLAETAAALFMADATISGDTGPAHISVAVGTPTIGLYGPTFPERSGPHGYLSYCLDRSQSCRCRGLKVCKLRTTPDSGECMRMISSDEVYGRLLQALRQLGHL